MQPLMWSLANAAMRHFLVLLRLTCVPGLNNLTVRSAVREGKWDRQIYSKAKGSSEAMCQFCFLSGPIDTL